MIIGKSGKGIFGKLLLLLIFIIVFLFFFGSYLSLPSNYDEVYQKLMESGEIINPALEYLKIVGKDVATFVDKEIDSPGFLNDNSSEEIVVINETETIVIPANQSINETEIIIPNETEFIPEENETEELIIKEEDKPEIIKYLLILVKAYNLHNPPFSSDTPKIEFIVENESFNAEILEGEIFVEKGSIENEDIRMITDWKEAVLISKGESFVQDSVIAGRTKIEKVCEDTVCFLKGYKDLFDELKSEE